MPRGSPFTTLCRRLADHEQPVRADLHVHTTASDGTYTPSQVVALARAARLTAVAITDHDTLAGIPEARSTPAGALEVVPGVEITAAYAGREIHLLGYWVRTDDPALSTALARLGRRRQERFQDSVARLSAAGVVLPADRVAQVLATTSSPGRRHIARLLVSAGYARSCAEAFHRYLKALTGRVVPKLRLPAEEAIALVTAAGGVTALAHPPPDLTEADLRTLAGWGLQAIEADYPAAVGKFRRRLREWAGPTGLTITGGSDCHGPEPPGRAIGSHGISTADWEALRERAGRTDSNGVAGRA